MTASAVEYATKDQVDGRQKEVQEKRKHLSVGEWKTPHIITHHTERSADPCCVGRQRRAWRSNLSRSSTHKHRANINVTS